MQIVNSYILNKDMEVITNVPCGRESRYNTTVPSQDQPVDISCNTPVKSNETAEYTGGPALLGYKYTAWSHLPIICNALY